MLTAEILATGDEIRTGALIDSNSAYIAQKLEAAGVHVTRHGCVGDHLEQISSAIRRIGARADLAVVTGGLGPTSDDLTAAAAANAGQVSLELNADAMASINAFFQARGRAVSEANRKPAHLPAGAASLNNPVGTAPGFSFKIGQCLFFFLPGVPFEMRRMLDDHILSYVGQLQGERRNYRLVKSLTIFGLPESVVGNRLEGLDGDLPEITLGLRAKFPEIQVKLYANGSDRVGLEQKLAIGVSQVCEELGDRVVSTDDQSIQNVVGDLLKARKATLALAESCTGGLIANWITDVPGSSSYFSFGGVTYANEAKIRFVGVDPAEIKRFGAVHETIVKQMAGGVRNAARTTYGLATSGIAGPDGGSPEKPVGTVCIGLATPDGVQGHRFHFSYGDRDMNKKIFAMKALDLLRLELLSNMSPV